MASFATQVQIRRGTEAENDAFTGAEGEVTMDLTNKQLRVHDGQTTGGMKIPNIETVFGTNQIANGAVTPEKLIGQPTFAGNAGKTLAVNQAGNGFEFVESTLPENTDYVIESQEPTAENGYTWYRLYKSGWVEQGGNFSGNSPLLVTLPITMANTAYSCFAGHGRKDGVNWNGNPITLVPETTTALGVYAYGDYQNMTGWWEVKGMSAQ